MPARTVEVAILGDAKSLDDAMAGSAVAADAAADDMGGSFDDVGGKIGNTFDKIGSKLSDLGIPGAAAFSAIGGKIDESNDKAKGFGATLSEVGGVALIAGAAGLAAFAGESIHLATDFQSTVTSIAANAGISVKAAQSIGNAFLDTAGTTIYSGQEIATAYKTVAGQLGQVQGHALNAHEAMQVMQAAMNAAEGSGTSLSSVTKALATVMQIYGIKAGGAAKASDQLFQAARLSGNTLSGVASTLAKMHTQLGVVTPPLAQTGALLVDLATHGEKGTKGLRSISTALTSLLKPSQALQAAQHNLTVVSKNLTPTLTALANQVKNNTINSTQLTAATKKLTAGQATVWNKFMAAHSAVTAASIAMTEHGLQVTKLTGKLKPLRTIITTLHKKIEGQTQAQGVATLSQYMSAKAASMLYDTVKAGGKAYDEAAKKVELHNAAQKAAEKQAQTLSHQLDQLKASVEDEAVKFGSFLIPKLEDLGKIGVKVIEFFEHSKPAAIALGVAVGGPLLAAVTKFSYDMGHSAVDSVVKFGQSLAHPIQALTGTGEAADEASDQSKAFQATLDSLDATIAGLTEKLQLEKAAIGEEATAKAKATETDLAFEKAMRSSTEALQSASDAEAALQEKSAALDEALADLQGNLDGVGEAATTAGAGLEGVGEAVATAAPEVEEGAEGMGAAVDSAFGPIGIAIMAVVAIAGLLVSHWKEAKEVLVGIWHGIEEAGEAAWNAIKDHLKVIIPVIVGIVTGGIGVLVLEVVEHWKDVEHITSEVWDDIRDHLKEIIPIIAGILTGGIGAVVVEVIEHWNTVKTETVRIWDDVIDFVKGIPGKILDVFKDAGKWLLDVGKDILEGLLHGIEDGTKDVIDGIKNVGSDITGAFKSVMSIFSPSAVFRDLGANVMKGLTLGITENGDKAVQAMTGVGSKLALVPFKVPPVTGQALAGGASGQLGAFTSAAGVQGSVAGTSAAAAQPQRVQNFNIEVESPATPHKISSAMAWAVKTAGD